MLTRESAIQRMMEACGGSGGAAGDLDAQAAFLVERAQSQWGYEPAALMMLLKRPRIMVCKKRVDHTCRSRSDDVPTVYKPQMLARVSAIVHTMPLHVGLACVHAVSACGMLVCFVGAQVSC